jgi:Polysaccharide biosynthesis protein
MAYDWTTDQVGFGTTLKPFDIDGNFRSVVESEGLRRTAVRGAVIAGQAGNFVVQIGPVVALARLLTPADCGIVTVVTAFSLLFRSFGLGGFTEVIMQCE